MNSKIKIPSGHPVVLMYEGSAERAILENLLENNLLKIDEKDLLEGEIFKRCALKKFCEDHLGHGMKSTVVLIRVIDSKNEGLNIPKSYKHKFDPRVIDIFTRPEIEILNILAEGRYKDFSRNHHGEKAKDYCRNKFKYSPTLRYNSKYWNIRNNNHLSLVQSIKEYDKLFGSKEFTLNNLLK